MNANTLRKYGLLSFGLLLVASGCQQAPAQQSKGEPKRPVVVVSHPVEQIVEDYEEFTGRVDAANKVAIVAMVTGYLKDIKFEDGADAAENDVLFEIDPRTFEAQYQLAQAAVEQAKATLQRLEIDYKRNKPLSEQGVVSKEDFNKLVGDLGVAKATVAMNEAQLQLADVNLKYTKVRSPLKGRTSRRLMDKGNMVKANESILTWVYQIDPMYGYFDVDEQTFIKLRNLINAGKIKSYRDGKIFVEIGLADEEGYSKSVKGAYINWVDSVLDAGTGTGKFRCILPQPLNDKGQPMVLVSPGMFARLKLPTSLPHKTMLISEKAVGTDQGEKFILVVNSQKKIERRNVTLGQMHNGLRVVENATTDPAKELKPSDLVVISGLQRVRGNEEVTWKDVVPMPRAGLTNDPTPAPLSSPSLVPGKSGN